MARKSFYDIIEMEEMDVSKEYARLCYRFKEAVTFYRDPSRDFCPALTMNRYFDEKFCDIFPFFIRTTSVNLEDFFDRIGLDIDKTMAGVNDIMLLAEVVACAKDNDGSMQDFAYVDLEKRIEFILERLGLRLVKGKNGRIVVPFDCKVNQAVELLSECDNSDSALEMLDYKHRSHNGDLKAKASILTKLALCIEPIIEDSEDETEENARFLLNNLGLRHNNKKGQTAKQAFIALSDKEKEKWYDKTYDTIVAVIVDHYQRNLNVEIGEFRKKFKK